MTLTKTQLKRKQTVRDIYALVKQLNEALGTDKGWGDVQDELDSAMSHLKNADLMLSAPDPDEIVDPVSTHTLVNDPPAALTSLKSRHTCSVCGMAVLTRRDGSTYGSATEKPCPGWEKS